MRNVKGVVRKIDELDRITIPKEMRDTLGLRRCDPVDIYIEDGVIHLESYGKSEFDVLMKRIRRMPVSKQKEVLKKLGRICGDLE